MKYLEGEISTGGYQYGSKEYFSTLGSLRGGVRRRRRAIDVAATLVLGVGERRHAQELAERSAGAAGETFVFRERQEDHVAGVVMNELGTINQGTSDDIPERALGHVKRPA